MGRLGTHAVYASSGGSPRRDARLASGCWPDSTGWAPWPTGFLRKVSSMLLASLSSFPRLTLAQAHVGPTREWHVDLEKIVTLEKLGSYPACPDSRKKTDLRAIRPTRRRLFGGCLWPYGG